MPEEKVHRVVEIFDAVGLRPAVESAINEEFAKARRALDEIGIDTPLKRPLYDLLDTLCGRKK